MPNGSPASKAAEIAAAMISSNKISDTRPGGRYRAPPEQQQADRQQPGDRDGPGHEIGHGAGLDRKHPAGLRQGGGQADQRGGDEGNAGLLHAVESLGHAGDGNGDGEQEARDEAEPVADAARHRHAPVGAEQDPGTGQTEQHGDDPRDADPVAQHQPFHQAGPDHRQIKQQGGAHHLAMQQGQVPGDQREAERDPRGQHRRWPAPEAAPVQHQRDQQHSADAVKQGIQRQRAEPHGLEPAQRNPPQSPKQGGERDGEGREAGGRHAAR